MLDIHYLQVEWIIFALTFDLNLLCHHCVHLVLWLTESSGPGCVHMLTLLTFSAVFHFFGGIF